MQIDTNSGAVDVNGKVFEVTLNQARTGRTICRVGLDDGTNAIYATFISNDSALKPEDLAKIQAGQKLRVEGRVTVDKFRKDTMIMGHYFFLLPPTPMRDDLSKDKRVELHLHSSEYEKKSQELIEYLSTIEGKEELTSEEQAKERKIYTEISAIIEDARKNHKSLINKKSESDFPKDPKENIKAKLEYFDKDIFPLMSKSRESALDGAEIFEKFCIKAELPSSNTMYSLSDSLSLLPKEMRTDEILNRYLEIMEKIGDKNSPYWESECVANILTTYASEQDRNDVSVETVLRGIALVKKLSNSSKGAQHVISELTNIQLGSVHKADNIKDDKRVISALDDLREYTKNMPF